MRKKRFTVEQIVSVLKDSDYSTNRMPDDGDALAAFLFFPERKTIYHGSH